MYFEGYNKKSQLDPSCGFWLLDCAQEVIPSVIRERQRDYFAIVSSEVIKSVYFTTIVVTKMSLTLFALLNVSLRKFRRIIQTSSDCLGRLIMLASIQETLLQK